MCLACRTSCLALRRLKKTSRKGRCQGTAVEEHQQQMEEAVEPHVTPGRVGSYAGARLLLYLKWDMTQTKKQVLSGRNLAL